MTETLFIKPEEQDNEPVLFPVKEDPERTSAPLSDGQKQTTATLAAFAQKWNAESDRSLAQITGLLTDRINRGEEEMIRNEIADTQRQEEISALTAAQLEAIGRQEMGLDGGVGLKQLMERQFQLETSPTNPHALEEEGVSAIQLQGATDPAQAVGYALNKDSLDAAYEAQAKYAIFNRALDERQQRLKEQGWPEYLLNILVIPGQGTLAQYMASNEDTAFIPGYNLEEQVQRLNAMSLDEYRVELPKVMAEIDRFSGLFAQNPNLAVNVLEKLKPTSDWGDAAMANFELGFDVVTTIPFAAAARIAKQPVKMIQMVGNRKAAVQTAAAAIQKDAMGLPDAQAGGLGNLTAANSGAVEAAIPSYSKMDLNEYVTPWVGISSDVTDAVASITEAAARIPRMTAKGTSADAVRANVNEFIGTLENRFRREGEDIADIHRVYPEPELPPRVDFPGGGRVQAGDAAAREHQNFMEGAVAEAQVRQQINAEERAARLPKRPAQRSVASLMKDYGVSWDTATKIKKGLIEVSDRALVSMGDIKPPIVDVDAAVKQITRKQEQPKTYEALDPELPPHAGEDLPPMVAKEFKDRLDIHEDSDLGIQTVSFYLGNKARPGGYLTADLAEEGAAKRGLSGHTIVESNGQFYIKVTEVVPETGSATLRSNDDLYPVNTISQLLRNPQQALPDLLNDARLSSILERGNLEADVIAPIARKITSLNKKEIGRHNKIITKGQDRRKVFKVDELVAQYEAEFGRGPKDKEIIAYYAHIQLNEVAESIINDYLYTLRARGGWKTGEILNPQRKDLAQGLFADREALGFATGRMNMREIDNPEWGSLRVFDFDENLTLHPGQGPAVADLRAKAKDKFATGNYRLVELEEEVMHNGDPVKFVLVHKGSSRMGPLERRQRKSEPWGRKENLNKHFVAQARSGKFKGSDVRYALNPVIHLSERTATRANERVEQLEAARLAWNDQALDPTRKRQIIERAVESVEKWEQMVKDGIIQTNHPFRYVEDRQLPHEYNRLADGTERWFSQEWTGSDRYYSSRRELFYQQDRDMLLDSSENLERNLDPTKVLNRAINTAINTKAFANYNHQAIMDWNSRLPAGAIVESSVGYSKDPYTIFFHGRFTEQFKKSPLYQRLEANRRIHQRFMNYKNGEQSLRDLFNRRIASWIDGKGEVRDWAATKFYDSQSRNPVDAVQGFVFDSYLGFFNPDQFFVQAQTAILATATHPIYGTQALAMSPWMTHMLLNRSDNLLDMYAKRLKYIHGLPEPEFKLMVNKLRESGWMKVQGSNIQLDYLTNRVGGGRIGRTVGGFRRGGRVLFNLAERYNRLTAYQIAWHDARKHFPDLVPGSDEFMLKVRQETDALTMNMTAASKTAWQNGLAAVPTKFLAYQAHVLENLLPKKFGGSTKIRGEQKFRLAVGQLALYGLGGGYGLYSLADYIHDSYKAHTGVDMPDEMYKGITRGIMDSMISAITMDELDSDLSSRVGWGAGLKNWYEKLTEGNFSSALDIFGGPTASLGNNWIDALTKVSRHIISADVHKITKEEWLLMGDETLDMIKSWKNVSQAYATYKLGQIKDPKTRQNIIPAGEYDAIANFFGIPLGPQTEFWREIRSDRKRGEIADDMAAQLASLRRLSFQALQDGDDKAAHNYNLAEGRIFDIIGDDYEMKRIVQRKLTQLLGYNDYNYDTMHQRIMQNQGRAPRAE